MHDIDRTFMEYDPEYENENDYESAFGYECENEQEYEPEFEYNLGYEGEGEYEGYENEQESVFDEAEEMELAADLLSVSSEAELDQFLGKAFNKVARKTARFVRKVPFKRVAGKLIKYARPLIKKALPIAGRAVGTYFGGPAGGQIGSMAAPRIGRMFGLELEGLSPEDQEFEVSRSTVRLLGNAIANAAKSPPSANPDTVAKAAIMKAVKTNAPGLLTKNLKRPPSPNANNIPGQRGDWYRNKRGNIVLVGL